MAELEIKPSPAARLRVVAVIVCALGIAFTLVLLLIGGLREFLTPKGTITTYMPDGTGLGSQSEVRLSGIRIGTVSGAQVSPSLDPQRSVRVDMQVSARFLRSIPRDSQASISSDTLVGNKFISIDEGKDPIPLSDNGELRSEPLKQAGDHADLIKALQDELKQIDDLLVQITDGKTTIGQFVVGEEAYDDFLKRISAFESTLHSFAASPAGETLFTNKLYDQIALPAARLDRTLESIQRGEGSMGHLFASDEQYNKLLGELRGLRSSLANIEKQPTLADDAAYRKAQAMLHSTDKMIDSMTMGEGTAARLLRDPQFYESLSGSIAKLQDFLKDFRENPRKYMRVKVR